jgi:hypothetical protein
VFAPWIGEGLLDAYPPRAELTEARIVPAEVSLPSLATARNTGFCRGLTPQAAHRVTPGKPLSAPIHNRKIEEKTMKHLGIAALGIVGSLAFAATSASAAIVCNDNGVGS